MASSFHATFSLNSGHNDNSTHREVRKFSITFNQATDQKGCPSSDVYGGFIYVTIVSNLNSDFHEWMIHPTKRLGGLIEFTRQDQNSILERVTFMDAYCVGLTEEFDAYSKDVLMVSLTISAKTIMVGAVTYTKPSPPW
jgi:hypothetical protein